MQELDLEKFEELFKTRAQGPMVDLSCMKSKVSQKVVNKVTILDANRSKNLAITLRKANKTTEEICKAIEKYAPFLNWRCFFSPHKDVSLIRVRLVLLPSGSTSRPCPWTLWSA